MFRSSKSSQMIASTASVVAVLMILIDAAGVLVGAWPVSLRLAGSVLTLASALGVLFGRISLEVHLVVGAVVLGALGLLGTVTPAAGALDPTSTLSMIVLIGVILVAIRNRKDQRPLAIYAAATAAYTVAVVLVDPVGFPADAGRLMIGIPVQVTVLVLLHRLITQAGRARAEAERSEVLERAMATCSEALLIQSSDDAVRTAVHSLLAATDAGYAYVDVNTIGPGGERRWTIVADAVEDGVFSGPDDFESGGYEDLPWLEESLEGGEPVTIDVGSLPQCPTRDRYLTEGVGSELIAPVHIDGMWAGSIGFASRDPRAWDPLEVAVAVRAAHMIGAYWARQRAREGLVALNDARSRFVASVGHELRTPMTAVLGFSSELARTVDDLSGDEVREMARTIQHQSEEVKSLIDDLLVVERSNVGDLTIKPTRFHILVHLQEIIGGLARTVVLPDTDAEVWTDELRLRQILRNLLTNAIKHGGEVIDVMIETAGDRVEVIVRDDGPGIGALDVDSIFDEFVRGSGEASRPDSVGLGLAVARRLARLCGGDLTHRRQNGRTHFTLSIPRPYPVDDDGQRLVRKSISGSFA